MIHPSAKAFLEAMKTASENPGTSDISVHSNGSEHANEVMRTLKYWLDNGCPIESCSRADLLMRENDD